MTIENAQKDIIDNFLFFDDWTQKYEYIIELSKDLEFMSENLKNEDNLIKGCQSKVWLHAEMVNGKINFLADSEAIITKGIRLHRRRRRRSPKWSFTRDRKSVV